MLKNILKVKGLEILTKKTQKTIRGGNEGFGNRREEGFVGPCQTSHDCTESNTIPSICRQGTCIYTSNWQNAC